MAVNGNRRRAKTDTAELSERLAPLEEQAEAEAEAHQPLSHARPAGGDDTIRVNTDALKFPRRLDEDDERKGADIFYLDPVVRVILLVMLAFIAFIAWQIARMPPAAK